MQRVDAADPPDYSEADRPSSVHESFREVRPDPLAAVFALGRRRMRTGALLALAGTLLIHGSGAAKGLSVLVELALFAARVRTVVVERLRATYDVEAAPPPKAELPPPPEEPEQKPLPRLRAEAPPPPAAAGKVLTSEPQPDDAPVDLTAWGMVSGEANAFVGGVTSTKGTSKVASQKTAPVASGVPGGTGTGPAPTKPAQDLSRPPGLPEGSSWDSCGFPAEADMDQIDFAMVTLAVTVAADGSPQSVSAVNDPGHGFGPLATQCARRKKYRPALDAAGNPIIKTIQFRVRFTRKN